MNVNDTKLVESLASLPNPCATLAADRLRELTSIPVNTDKAAIQRAIEIALARRLGNQPINVRRADGSPTANALREQAAFIAGAASALQAVFGDSTDTLTDYVPPAWILEPMRGNLL